MNLFLKRTEYPVKMKRYVTKGTNAVELNNIMQNLNSDSTSKICHFNLTQHCIIRNQVIETEYNNHEVASRCIDNGQLKLLMMEILFMSMVYEKTETRPCVIYIGAAPGDHLVDLIKLFPLCDYHLYDSSSFSEKLYNFRSDNPDISLSINNELFTTAHTEMFKNSEYENIYFISDIRAMEYKSSGTEYSKNKSRAAIIEADMNLQLEIVTELKPKAFSLKFKVVPESTSFFYYPKGVLFKQPWTRAASTELRLISTNYTGEEVEYNAKLINENNTNLNNTVKRYTYINPETGIADYIGNGLKNDYYSIYTLYIIHLYLKRFFTTETEEAKRLILDMLYENYLYKY